MGTTDKGSDGKQVGMAGPRRLQSCSTPAELLEAGAHLPLGDNAAQPATVQIACIAPHAFSARQEGARRVLTRRVVCGCAAVTSLLVRCLIHAVRIAGRGMLLRLVLLVHSLPAAPPPRFAAAACLLGWCAMPPVSCSL